MAKLFSKIASRVRSVFKGKPKAPKIPQTIAGGHRGIAAGSLKERQRKQAAGEAPFSLEEIQQWATLTPEATSGFLDGEPLFVHSSNVNLFQFHPETNQLMVEFKAKGGKPASAYLYDNISVEEATRFVTALSKGHEVWATLRVLGSKTAHKKPYTRIR